MAENKVQFNLKNVHYAVLTEGVDTQGQPTFTYATPVHVPGAVSLSLDAEGEVTKFYADGIVYYNAIANNGYNGNLEMARFPDQMLKDIWGFDLDAAYVLTEKADTEPKSFALLYQIDGDSEENLYVLYKCSATRPGVGSSTLEDTKEPVTQTSEISATPRSDMKILGKTTTSVSTATRNGWFAAVYDA